MNLQDIFESKKEYIVEGIKYTAIANFMSDRLVIKLNDKILLNESLKNYENTDGLNMEGYVNKKVREGKHGKRKNI
tara:strand:+ start:279 stop:506 length:228 start_codon:yes stop_codon:yes gene_type:complete